LWDASHNIRQIVWNNLAWPNSNEWQMFELKVTRNLLENIRSQPSEVANYTSKRSSTFKRSVIGLYVGRVVA